MKINQMSIFNRQFLKKFAQNKYNGYTVAPQNIQTAINTINSSPFKVS